MFECARRGSIKVLPLYVEPSLVAGVERAILDYQGLNSPDRPLIEDGRLDPARVFEAARAIAQIMEERPDPKTRSRVRRTSAIAGSLLLLASIAGAVFALLSGRTDSVTVSFYRLDGDARLELDHPPAVEPISPIGLRVAPNDARDRFLLDFPSGSRRLELRVFRSPCGPSIVPLELSSRTEPEAARHFVLAIPDCAAFATAPYFERNEKKGSIDALPASCATLAVFERAEAGTASLEVLLRAPAGSGCAENAAGRWIQVRGFDGIAAVTTDISVARRFCAWAGGRLPRDSEWRRIHLDAEQWAAGVYFASQISLAESPLRDGLDESRVWREWTEGKIEKQMELIGKREPLAASPDDAPAGFRCLCREQRKASSCRSVPII